MSVLSKIEDLANSIGQAIKTLKQHNGIDYQLGVEIPTGDTYNGKPVFVYIDEIFAAIRSATTLTIKNFADNDTRILLSGNIIQENMTCNHIARCIIENYNKLEVLGTNSTVISDNYRFIFKYYKN